MERKPNWTPLLLVYRTQIIPCCSSAQGTLVGSSLWFTQVGPNLHLQHHVSLSCLQHTVCSGPVEQLAILWIFHIFWLFYASIPSVEGILPPSLLLVILLYFHLDWLQIFCNIHHLLIPLLHTYSPLLNFFEMNILHQPQYFRTVSHTL